jgi:hypothetical protein
MAFYASCKTFDMGLKLLLRQLVAVPHSVAVPQD